MSILGKRFIDAGLREICVESGILGADSTYSVFDGKALTEQSIRFILSDENMKCLEEFTCKLYSLKHSTNSINDLRYNLFLQSKGKLKVTNCLHV